MSDGKYHRRVLSIFIIFFYNMAEVHNYPIFLISTVFLKSKICNSYCIQNMQSKICLSAFCVNLHKIYCCIKNQRHAEFGGYGIKLGSMAE